MENSYNGYTLRFYAAADNKVWDDRYQINKARPYDEADYYGAFSYDKKVWKITYKNKVIEEMPGTFENVVDYIESRNKSIKPQISYN